MAVNRVRSTGVEVAGRSYRVRSDEPAEVVRAVAREVDALIEELRRREPRLSLQDALVLAALNLALSRRSASSPPDPYPPGSPTAD